MLIVVLMQSVCLMSQNEYKPEKKILGMHDLMIIFGNQVKAESLTIERLSNFFEKWNTQMTLKTLHDLANDNIKTIDYIEKNIYLRQNQIMKI